MSLRKRTSIVVGSVLALLVAILYVASQTLMLGSFAELEERDTRQNVQRVVNALADELDALNEKSADWAVWDDLYRFVQDHNQEFIDRNLLDRTFSDMRLNLILLADSSGQIVYAKGFDLESAREAPVSKALPELMTSDSVLLSHTDLTSSTKGLVLLPEAPMLVSSRPIITSDGSGPIQGTVIFGRYLDSAEIGSLSDRTRVAVDIPRVDDPQLPADISRQLPALSTQNPISVSPVDSNTVAGYTLLADVHGNAALILRAQMPRSIYQRGQTSINYLVGLILVVGTVFGLLTLLILEKLVLGRLARLNSEVGRIGFDQNLSARVTVSGSDELSNLASSTNEMLSALDSLHKEVRSSEERYRAFVERSSDAVMRLEMEIPLPLSMPQDDHLQHFLRYGYLAECNDVTARICGFSSHTEAEGTRVSNLDKSLVSEIDRLGREFVHSGYQMSDAEVILPGDHDGKRHFLCTVVGIVENGALVRLWGTLRDITDRKRLEDQLMRAQRLETAGKIAGQVAHDFNNLLSPAIAYPELIKMQLPEGHPAVEYCDAMLEAAECMAAINEDMMALGRRGLLREDPFDLNGQIQWALDQMRSRPGTLSVRLELAPDLLFVKGSPTQLSRVITNLVVNAREAMDDAGNVTVRTENVTLGQPLAGYQTIPPGEYVRMEVSDQGRGIPREIRDKVFDPFFTTNPGRHQGAGLGLSVVLSIIGDHHGYVDLASEIGKGTSVYVYLPAWRERVADLPSDEVLGGSESVLIVDDDRLHQQAAAEMLRTLHYRVAVASSGKEAIAYLKDNPADLLILDMIMPELNGVETYRKILEFKPKQRAIVISGFSESELVREAQALGAGAYVRKPVNLRTLAQAVREELLRSA